MSSNLLLLGSGDPHYRGYSLEALSDHFRVCLVDASASDWQKSVVDEHVNISHRDPAAVVELIRRHPNGFDGIFTYDEFAVETVAEVATATGLRSNPTSSARACRDKAEMRARLAAGDVPSARSIQVGSLVAARRAAREIDYPVVLKPQALAGSIGVIRVDTDSDLDRAYEIARGSGHGTYGSSDGRLLVEQYLDGPEISVECVVRSGVPDVVAITRKSLGPAPYFEEIGHVVAPGEAVTVDDSAIVAVVRAAHAALGLRWGASHTELRLTGSGPRVIEIGARPGGDLIPLLVRLATGRDQVVEAAAAVCGEDLAPCARSGADIQSVAAVRFFYPPAEGRLTAVHLAPEIASAPWLHVFATEVAIGSTLRLPPQAFLDRVGFAVVEDESIDRCLDHLAAVEDGLTTSFDQLSGTI